MQAEEFKGTVEPHGSGSLIRGHFRMGGLGMLFGIVWLAITTPPSIWALNYAISHGERLPGVLVYLIFPGVYLAFLTIARVFALAHEPKVVEMLQEIGSVAP